VLKYVILQSSWQFQVSSCSGCLACASLCVRPWSWHIICPILPVLTLMVRIRVWACGFIIVSMHSNSDRPEMPAVSPVSCSCWCDDVIGSRLIPDSLYCCWLPSFCCLHAHSLTLLKGTKR